MEGPWGRLRGETRQGTSTFPTAGGTGAIFSSIRTWVGVDFSPSQHPKTKRVAQICPLQRAEVMGSLEDRSGGAKKWPHTFGTRKRHSSSTLPSRALARLLPRSLHTTGLSRGPGGDGGSRPGLSRESGVSSTDQTRQQNLWYQT